MSGFIDFFNITNEGFTQKDSICHSLIEATLFNNYSIGYIQSMLNILKMYDDKNGNDFTIDIVFNEYLENALSKGNQIEISNFIDSKISNIDSFYLLFFICYFDSSGSKKIREQIISQKYKLLTNEPFIINDFKISKFIVYYTLKKYDPGFSNYMSINQNSNNYNYIFETNRFWQFADNYSSISDFKIDVRNDPFLLHSAACLKMKNNNVTVIFDIKNFKLPENISFELIRILMNNINSNDLLEIKTISVEFSNLCSITSLLYNNNAQYDDLMNLQNNISNRSLMILLLLYSKIIKKNFPLQIVEFILGQININDSEDSFFATFLLNNINSKIPDFYNIIPLDFIYIYSVFYNDINIDNNILLSAQYYGVIKKEFFKGNKVINGLELIIQKFKRNFIRFINRAISSSICNFPLPDFNYNEIIDCKEVIKIIINHCNNNLYDKAYNLLMMTSKIGEIKNYFSNEENSNILKNLIDHLNIYDVVKICDIFKIEDLFTEEQKNSYYFSFPYSSNSLYLSRESVLDDSIYFFKDQDMKLKKIIVQYVDEYGVDGGGLSRDWFSSVCQSLNDSFIFKTVPNGNSLTIGSFYDKDLLTFIGQFVGTAFNNRVFVNLKLSSFIWKIMMDEKITIDDMLDYDSEIYNSLKWIKENDPAELNQNFVDSNSEELCENGKNIILTNQNKDKYIKLLIDRILIGKNSESFELISEGFKQIVDFDKIKIFRAEEIKKIVNGIDYIDVDNWRKNSRYDKNSDCIQSFFNIIENWSEDQKQKLLKFVTGLSVLPINGFIGFYDLGGPFTICVCHCDFGYPTASTCSNTLYLPNYYDYWELEENLLTAIENEEFGFS